MYNKGRFINKTNRILNTSNFNKSQAGMIVRLISQHIELNHYLATHSIKDPSTHNLVLSPKCTKCNNNRDETVPHYMMKCPKYVKHRNQTIWMIFFLPLNRFHVFVKKITHAISVN